MLEELKKIELHCHLDGSVRPSTVSEILNMPLEEAEKQMCFKEAKKDLNKIETLSSTASIPVY